MALLSKHELQEHLEEELSDADIGFLDQDWTLRLESSTKIDGEYEKQWINIEFQPDVEDPSSYWVNGGVGFGKDYSDRFYDVDELVKYIRTKIIN